MPDYYTDHIKSGSTTFKLLSSYIEFKGNGSIVTYQNIGSIQATIQGSLDNINWTTIAGISAGDSKVLQQTFTFIRQLEPLADVMVSRGLD